MPKYKYFWYPHIVTLLKEYPDLGDTPKGREALDAITSVIIDYIASEDVEKLKLMNLYYFSNSFTMEGAAQKLFRSRRSTYYLAEEIINKVAEKLEYL